MRLLPVFLQSLGPMLTSVLKETAEVDIKKLYFMNSAIMNLFGVEGCRVTRCGYTGEDGVEVQLLCCQVVVVCSYALALHC